MSGPLCAPDRSRDEAAGRKAKRRCPHVSGWGTGGLRCNLQEGHLGAHRV